MKKTLSILALLTTAALGAVPAFAVCRDTFVIDNLAPNSVQGATDPNGTGVITYAGAWTTDTTTAGYMLANRSLVSAPGDPASVYTWRSFVLDPSLYCTYRVSAWWTAASDRTTAAFYRVNEIDPAGLQTVLLSATVSQQAGANQWNPLGTVTVRPGYVGRVKVLATNVTSTQRVAADAVQFVLIPDTLAPTASITSAVVTGASASFVWTGTDDATPTGSLLFKYRLAPLEAAFRPLSSSTSATYSGLANGTYTLYVKAKDLYSRASVAAAQAITVSYSPTCASEIIIDNLAANSSGISGPGTVSFTNGTATGWVTAGTGGAYNAAGTSNASVFPSASGGTGATYTWTTATLNTEDTCTYAVSVWWTASQARTTSAPFEVSGHVGGPTTVTYNQQANGGQWNEHGTYTFAAGSHAAVKMTDVATGKAIADAVRFVLQPDASGDLTLWSMDTAVVRGISQPVNQGAAWSVAAIADFNGDAKADLLWVNRSTGETLIQLLDGTAGNVVLASGSPGTLSGSQAIMDAGDFDGDGKADVAILDPSSRTITIRLMNGTIVKSGSGVVSPALGMSLNFKAVADFDGDGKADFLMFDTSAASSPFSVWAMNGTSRSSNTSIAAPLTAGYSFFSAGDFDGDGKADILLYNPSAGTVIVWLLAGGTATVGSALQIPAGTAIQGIGDYDGDGKADVLFKNISTGATTIWFMNGAVVVGTPSSSNTAGLDLIFQ